MDEQEFVVILSNIYIGTSTSTVWYRKEVHEKHLIAVFDDIIACADQIREVILLGDIFDFWMYPANEIPPTIDDIIQVNPNILGPDGKLSQALSAVKGRMLFIPGDHDMILSEADLHKLRSEDGYQIKCHAGSYTPDYDSSVIFTHGHEFSMLNAPFYTQKLSGIPIGYFAARAFSYKIKNDMKDSFTEFLSQLSSIHVNYESSIDSVINLIDAIIYLTGIPKDLPIQVDRTTSISLEDVKNIYSKFNSCYYTWEENKTTFGDNIRTVVMSHTHLPAMKLGKDKIYYVNTGFMCPSSRVLYDTPITYGVYDRTHHCFTLMKVKSETEIIGRSTHITQLDSDDKYTFGWSVYNASYEYFRTMQDGVLAKAKELGILIISQDQKSDSIEMITGSVELIKKDINALLISPYNPQGVPIITADANKKGIPVVVIDGGTGGADVLAFIVSDSFGGGILAGEYAIKLIKKYSIKSKKVAIIKAEPTATYALLRGKGFKSVMTDNGYQVVAEISALGEQVPAYEAMNHLLESYKNDLAAVFCENGLMTLGAAEANAQAGKKGEIMMIGFDADPSVLEAIKKGEVQGTIAQQPFKMGEIGVEIANAALLGKPISYDDRQKKEILMEVYLINENGEAKMNLI